MADSVILGGFTSSGVLTILYLHCLRKHLNITFVPMFCIRVCVVYFWVYEFLDVNYTVFLTKEKHCSSKAAIWFQWSKMAALQMTPSKKGLHEHLSFYIAQKWKKNNKTTTLSKTKHNSPKMSSNSLLFISMVTSLITMVTFIITMVSYTHVKWAIHRIQNMKENIFFCTKHLFYFDVIFLTYCGIIFFPPLQ